jgi:hypothetical protein
MQTFTFGETPEKIIHLLCQHYEQEPFHMSLVGADRAAMRLVWRVGIDAHLQAIVHSQASDDGHRLSVSVDHRDLPVILRRLAELAQCLGCLPFMLASDTVRDAAWSLRTTILGQLGVEEV